MRSTIDGGSSGRWFTGLSGSAASTVIVDLNSQKLE
jgi:hypothetical protein